MMIVVWNTHFWRLNVLPANIECSTSMSLTCPFSMPFPSMLILPMQLHAQCYCDVFPLTNFMINNSNACIVSTAVMICTIIYVPINAVLIYHILEFAEPLLYSKTSLPNLEYKIYVALVSPFFANSHSHRILHPSKKHEADHSSHSNNAAHHSRRTLMAALHQPQQHRCKSGDGSRST